MIDSIVTNLGALPGEVVLDGGQPPAKDDVLATSKGNVTVRVAWKIPPGVFLSYDGPVLVIGDTVDLQEQP